MAAASRSIVINAPAERIFDIITDYEKYPEFLPEVKAVRVTGKGTPQTDVHYEVDVMKRIKYTVRMKEERPRSVSWTFVTGEVMKDNKGSWTLEPQGDKTHVTYQLEMALGAFVPKSIVNALAETQLPKMLEAFKQRAERG